MRANAIPGGLRIRDRAMGARSFFAATSFVLAMWCCEKAAGGEVAPLPFTPDRETPLLQKISELESLIRAGMTRDNIPGVSVALIRDGETAWKDGYGVANTITRRSMSADTPFEGASLGKCVTTYAALNLAQNGSLELNRPLSTYLEQPFVSDSTFGDAITAWHVMTHTSGLSNDLLEKTHHVSFEPGSRFSYSGVGYMYLQRVIEAITREPFDVFMRRTIFDPLAMRSSSYLRGFGRGSMSRGHGYIFGVAVPWPFAPVEQPNAANLLCTTAADMARFATELMNPTIVDRKLTEQMLAPQVDCDVDHWWGLGIGIARAGDARCFWHWGDNLDFQTYMVGCPTTRTGVVVMTNSSRGRRVTREAANRALSG